MESGRGLAAVSGPVQSKAIQHTCLPQQRAIVNGSGRWFQILLRALLKFQPDSDGKTTVASNIYQFDELAHPMESVFGNVENIGYLVTLELTRGQAIFFQEEVGESLSLTSKFDVQQ